MSSAELPVPKIDTTVAHPARRYDYWLGGKDNFAADRAAGDAIAEVYPAVRTAVRENRRFLGRAVTYLAGEAGIDQFLDIGTGIPTANNTHEVAQRINPAARVVYVDNDPIVLAHARALLTSQTPGATAYLDADLRDPEKILHHPDLAATLDLSRPVALMLVAVLHFIEDRDDPYGAVSRLVSVLPSGSYVVISHATVDLVPEEIRERSGVANAPGQGAWQFRTRAEFAGFFKGLDLMEPGIVPLVRWRAHEEPGPRPEVPEASLFAAVARVP